MPWNASPEDSKRLAYVVRSLVDSMARPLTAPGSEALAQAVISQLSASEVTEVLGQFGTKILQTLRDGNRHSTLAVPPGGGVLIWFVAWPGSHEDVLPQRFGEYFGMLYGQARWLVDTGAPLTGFLEIDAYVIGAASLEEDAVTSDKAVELAVEYSYLPGWAVGGLPTEDPRFKVLIVNRDLCSAEQRQALEKFMA